MNHLLVSVVVPVYNGERFLGEALESAMAQDYPRLDVVVVDDGSTDGSAAVARRFPVRLLQQPNRGVAVARNAGIAATQGEYIAFLDQDDLWLPGKTELQAGFLDAHPATIAVLSYQRLFLEPGVERPSWLKEEHLARPQVGYLPSALMARREAFARIGAFDPSYSTASDADWFFRAAGLGLQPLVLPDVLVNRRIHEANQSHSSGIVPRELLRVARSAVAARRDK